MPDERVESSDGARSSSVVRSKITQPSTLTDVVSRERLARQILDDRAPVVMVVAAAGYGKTTLLTEVVDLAATPVAWVNVDAADNDPMRFWSHLAAALREIGVDTGTIDQAIDRGSTHLVDDVTIAIDATGTDHLVVLDDVHELDDPSLVAQLNQLVNHRPQRLRLLAAARVAPAWSIDRLRTRGEVIEIGPDDLALTGLDGRRVLSSEIDDGLIDIEAADEMVRKVEGWPAGLRLAKLALRAHARHPGRTIAPIIGGDQPAIARYLAGEVLASRPDEEREFLLATSVLDRLTPDASAAVTGRADSGALLRQFVADNVFTSVVDEAGPVFAYHGLLREFLMARFAERGADVVVAAHARALRHAQSIEDTAAIVRHAVGADRRDVALERLADVYIDIANEGRIHELWSWVGAIGVEHVLAHPVLSAAPAWASLNRGRYDEIEPWLQSINLLDEVSDAHAFDFALHSAACRSHRDRHLGNLSAAVAHGRTGVELLDANGPDEIVIAASVTAATGAALVLTGELDEGAGLLRRALDLVDAVGERSSAVFAHGHLALALHLQGDSGQALVHADEAIGQVDSPSVERFHVPAVSWLVRGAVALESGRIGDAAEYLGRARQLAVVAREPATEALIDATDARRLHVLGDEAGCRDALRRADRLVAACTENAFVAEHVRSARASTRFASVEARHAADSVSLSPREAAVLALLPHGLSRRELATQLFVSENTVKTHLTSIRHKLGVPARADIVERARALGLLAD